MLKLKCDVFVKTERLICGTPSRQDTAHTDPNNRIICPHLNPIRFKPVEIIRLPEFNHELAKFLVGFEQSGEETVDWLVEETYFHLKRPVLDWNGNPVDFDLVEIESLFGEDARRYINGYKQFSIRMPRQKLQRRCVERIAWIDVARINFLSRHTHHDE